MADAIAVFPPGFRVTDDSTGEPVPGAIISFFDAGTTAPKTVYGDEDLTVEIGTEITCDALGYPTSDGSSTRTLIYVGTADYKIVCTDADENPLWNHDNVKGAVVSADSSNVSVTATFPVVSKSLDYTILAADQNKTFKVNPSAGDVAMTLPSAVTVGTGWKVKIQHAGTANQVLIKVATGSGQLISEGSKSYGGTFSLALNGEDCEVTSDGGNWLVSSHTPPFLKIGQGIIPVVSWVSSAPSSPVEGSIYLASASGTWVGVSVAASDVVQWSGALWVPFTPYTDCGWTAFVANEDRNYQFVNSAWVKQALSTPADQAAMEAITAGRPVIADVQRFHPGHPKAWAEIASDGSIVASYGISGVARPSTGNYTISFTVAFSSANYAAIATPQGVNVACGTQSYATGSVILSTFSVISGSAANAGFCIAFFGDQ
jgi:hypothetical protein